MVVFKSWTVDFHESRNTNLLSHWSAVSTCPIQVSCTKTSLWHLPELGRTYRNFEEDTQMYCLWKRRINSISIIVFFTLKMQNVGWTVLYSKERVKDRGKQSNEELSFISKDQKSYRSRDICSVFGKKKQILRQMKSDGWVTSAFYYILIYLKTETNTPREIESMLYVLKQQGMKTWAYPKV